MSVVLTCVMDRIDLSSGFIVENMHFLVQPICLQTIVELRLSTKGCWGEDEVNSNKAATAVSRDSPKRDIL